MKIFRRILVLNVFLFLANWNLAFSDVSLTGNHVRPEFSKLMSNLWRTAEEKFGKVSNTRISINKIKRDKLSHFYGQSLGLSIFLNPNVSFEEQKNALKHELYHVYLNKSCSVDAQEYPLIHEVFAQWENRDYLRISSSQNTFVYRKEAKAWLSRYSHSYNSQNFGRAVARLLSVPGRRKELNDFFKAFFKNCNTSQKLDLYHQKLFSLLNLEVINHENVGKLSFALYDTLTKSYLEKQGEVFRRDRVGSVLKPLAFILSSKFFAPKISREDLTWACPDLKSMKIRKRWTWDNALVKSCNGFFLDTPVDNDKPFHRAWERYVDAVHLDHLPKTISKNQLIGLVDGIQLDLSEIVDTYSYVAEKSPKVLLALKETSSIGTVSSFHEADWFHNNNILLKTGSVRSSNGAPEIGIIVAIGLDHSMRFPRFISVIRESGASTKQLLKVLYKKLLPYVELTKEVQLQILGLVPKSDLQFSCSDLRVSKDRIRWEKQRSIKWMEGHYYKCLEDGIKVSFPYGRGRKNRTYHGVIEYRPIRVNEPVKQAGLSKKMIRARRGSEFIFHTSLYNYLINTLGAEYPNGKREVLKALAVSSTVNVHSKRHQDRPICDTTHCQVFSPFERLPNTVKKRIHSAIVDVFSKDVFAKYQARTWMPFYLGGAKGWSQDVNISAIRRKLGFVEPITSLSLINNYILVVTDLGKKKISCESFRNKVNLKSCPLTMSPISTRQWRFTGKGAGHGVGMDLDSANIMAARGIKVTDILKTFYE